MEHKEPGIYRLIPKGEIFDGYYDHDTQMIGPFSVQCKTDWSDEWHTTQGVPNIYHLYKALLFHEQAYCAFFINNDIVAFALPDILHCATIYKDMKWFDYYDKPMTLPDYKSIGYVKTYAKTVSVGMAPFALAYDEHTGKACVHGKWVDLPSPPALKSCPISAYSELIKTDYEAVYYNTDNVLTFL